MTNLLIDLLKKTKLTRTITNQSKYYPNAGPARREGQASIDALVSFANEQQNNILPGTPISPQPVTVYQIGDSALGGIIAYILQSGDPGYVEGQQHGLVATVSDVSNSAAWGCAGVDISGADGQAIGDGNQNTIDIMAGCPTAGIAARLCGDLSQGGYSDWYLPSLDELTQLYNNRVAIGGFSPVTYWSSSEFTDNNALTKNFSTGGTSQTGKGNTLSVRAIRSF
jgi:Protein of unknown function (DUF1566)